VLERVAVLDPDHRPELAAKLSDAGFEVVVLDHRPTAVGPGADLVVVIADEQRIDELPELREHLGPETPIVVAIAGADAARRLDEVTAVGIGAVVVDGSIDEIVHATLRVASSDGYIAEGAMRPVLEEIHRLRVRDQERNVELEELVRRLKDISIDDGVTGLRNDDYFYNRLDDELGRALRHRRQLSVLLCEIDGFAATVEARGRRVADRMLREVAAVVDAGLRTGDVVSRINGEGFAMLLPETDSVAAMLVADRMREQVAGLVIADAGRVTASVGLASAPEHAVDRDGLMEAAERALYFARREGRNSTRTAGGGQVAVFAFKPSMRRDSKDQVIGLLVRVLRLRDPALADHATRTADLAVALGVQVGLGTSRLDHLRVAALLQDVGKIGVPDSILHKRGGLTAEEWAIIQNHPKRGFELVGGLIDPEAAEAVLNNHERWDGRGYPRAIEGEDIPLLARVLLVADAYTAMTSDRSFKVLMASSEALAELRRNAGSQFDPSVVAAMTELAAATDGVGDDGLQAVADPVS